MTELAGTDVTVTEYHDSDGYRWEWEEPHGIADAIIVQRVAKWIPNSKTLFSESRIAPGGWNQPLRFEIGPPPTLAMARDMVRDLAAGPRIRG